MAPEALTRAAGRTSAERPTDHGIDTRPSYANVTERPAPPGGEGAQGSHRKILPEMQSPRRYLSITLFGCPSADGNGPAEPAGRFIIRGEGVALPCT